MKKLKRQCAVCGERIQSNVVFKWLRHRDNVEFHICGLCREANKVNKDNVTKFQNNTYTTYNPNYATTKFSGPTITKEGK